MIKFIHLTDLHLTGADEDCQGYDTYAATERALGHAVRLFPDSDFAVITGDLANWGQPEAYARLKDLLAGVPLPVMLMIGNHDNRVNFLSAFGDRHPFALPWAQYVLEHRDHLLMFLDSQTVGTHGGAFSPDRLAWMDDTLQRADRRVLMFMHHHPVSVGAPSLDHKGMRNWPEFHAILRRHRDKIRHIFHGHCHTMLQGNIEGVSFSGLRSMGPQAYTDLQVKRATRWEAPPHYAVALVSDNAVVTHVHEFDYEGPFHSRDLQKFEDFIALCAARGVTVPLSEPIANAAE